MLCTRLPIQNQPTKVNVQTLPKHAKCGHQPLSEVRKVHFQDAISVVYFNNQWEENIQQSALCTSALCTKWATIQEEQRNKEMNKIKVETTVFTIRSTPIKKVDKFKYLGRMLEKMTMIGQL
jgi:hypothetical protein